MMMMMMMKYNRQGASERASDGRTCSWQTLYMYTHCIIVFQCQKGTLQADKFYSYFPPIINSSRMSAITALKSSSGVIRKVSFRCYYVNNNNNNTTTNNNANCTRRPGGAKGVIARNSCLSGFGGEHPSPSGRHPFIVSLCH